ncbi:MAG: GNAT family N-acetyltransferase [Planctomycetota bacterium]
MTETRLLAQAITVRLATRDDAAALLQLHHEGFGSRWSMAQWRWRFVDNPTGRTAIAGAFDPAGRCLAAFCGVPLRCRYRGEDGLVTRAGDVVVHPQLRRSVVGAKLLVRTGDLFFATFGGGRTRVVYGCPELALRRTAVRHLRCDILGDLPALVRPVDGGVDGRGDEPAVSGVVVEERRHLPDDLDALCARCTAATPTGLVRDGAFLRWRYDRNPLVDYVVHAARDAAGGLRGVAVLRRGGLHDESCSVVELLVPPGDQDCERALLRSAEDAARARGLGFVLACFSPTSDLFERLQHRHGFRVRLSSHQIVFRTYAAGCDRRFLFDEWFYSLGDFDFA